MLKSQVNTMNNKCFKSPTDSPNKEKPGHQQNMKKISLDKILKCVAIKSLKVLRISTFKPLAYAASF